MGCHPQCIISSILGIFAMAVLILVPIYYLISTDHYYPRRSGDFPLPFETDFVKVIQIDEKVMIYLRLNQSSDYAMSLQLSHLGPNVYMKSYNVLLFESFIVAGIGGSLTFNRIQSLHTFYSYHVKSADRSEIYQEEICIDMHPEKWSWYGGPSQSHQYWPVDRMRLENYAYVSKHADHGSVAERYWLNSAGGFIHVMEDVSLFVNQNVNNSKICLVIADNEPYRPNHLWWSLHIGIGVDAVEAHRHAVLWFLDKPSKPPDERMIWYPIWSTLPRYMTEVNSTVVLQLADEIERHGFQHAQIEIDDNWEECYGSLTFDQRKFPNVRSLTDQLKARGFRTTLWIHPFVNKECDKIYGEGYDNEYFYHTSEGEDTIQWWRSNQEGSACIDFTQPRVADWFRARLEQLIRMDGIDSFNFDAGESSWVLPKSSLNGYMIQYPTLFTTRYVEMASFLGPMVQVRSAFRNQELGIFLRMRELNSSWSWDNGLPNLITKLLQLNMVGYEFVVPGVIGGNDGQLPEKELFIRWVQANTFMPVMHFSYAPWDYDEETIAICKKFTELHASFSLQIVSQYHFSGTPMNPPIWWIAPLDRTAHQINDEFMLRDRILVAPVLQMGQTSRNIYLPRGEWNDPNRNISYTGPIWLMNYPAPLDVLPYFIYLFDLDSDV